MSMKLSRTPLIFSAVVGAVVFSAPCPSRTASAAGAKVPCTNMSRDCIIEVARTYLDARTDNSATPKQRLAPGVRRWENGVLTADRAADILSQHYLSDSGPSRIYFPRDLDRVFVQGDQAIFLWKIDVKKAPNGPFTSTVHLIERIQVDPGKAKCGAGLSPCITEIEVVFCTAQHPLEPTKPPPPKLGVHFSCSRAG